MLAGDLGTAFDELIAVGPLTVAYQPIVDLESGDVEAYEVLGRCGELSPLLAHVGNDPASLLAAAHRHGRLLELDRRWREIALTQIARRHEPGLRIHLNVDPRVAECEGFEPGFTRALIAALGLAPDRFVLELTETAETPQVLAQALAHYAAQGFRLAIDDLGAGAHSLATLVRVQPHVIKLDRSLIHQLHTDPRRLMLVRSLASYATGIGSRAVAEGIETTDELRAVRDAGVHSGQGFLLGRPAPAPTRSEPVSLDVARALRDTVPSRPHPRSARELTSMLVEIVDDLTRLDDLDRALQRVTGAASQILDVERVSLRLLDESRTRLLVAARSGPSIHRESHTAFEVGEGLIGWVVANASPLRIGRAESDPRFVARDNQITHINAFLGVPLFDPDGCIGVLSTASVEPDRFSHEDEERLRLIAGMASPHLRIGRLRRLALTDPLTCLLNRHALETVIPEAFSGNRPMSVALLDIDHFKQINDSCGHGTGDVVLREVADVLAGVVRAGDYVVRLGGEEFLVVLHGANEDVARVVAERARHRVTGLRTHRVTTSAGVAQRRVRESRASLIARADAALYRAKALGRNCVVIDGYAEVATR